MSSPGSQPSSPPKKFVNLWGDSNVKNGCRNHFYLDNGRIISKVAFCEEGLAAERAWLLYLRAHTNPAQVVLPLPIGSVVEDSGFFCLYLHVIPGQTLDQWITSNGPLSDDLACRVVDAYLALRSVPTSPDDHVVPGGLAWPVTGQIFDHDNDAAWVVSTRTQFNEMMAERFRIGVGPRAKVPGGNVTFAHGDISPTNILVTPDQRIAFLDFGMSAWLPEWWDAYILTRDQYARPPGFLGPMRKAFAAKGIGMDENSHTRLLLQIFDGWSKSQKARWYQRSLQPERVVTPAD